MEQDAERLVREAKKGDSEAFTLLVLECEHMLARTAMTVLKNVDDAADAVQEAVLEAWRKLGTLRQPRYFKTWLVRILLHKCYDLCETREKHRHGELEAALDAAEEKDRDAVLDVRAALDELSGDDKLLLGLFYYDCLSIREISGVLGLSEAAVKQRLHRGRQRFQAVYAEQEGFCHEE